MSPRLREWIVPGLVGLAVAGLILLGWAQRERYTPVGIGSEAPSYAAPTLAGDTLSLEALRGRVVLLNIWATWCPPCRYEMPSLQRLQDELRADGLVVVAVSVDEPPVGTPQRVAEFVNEYGLDFPILLDPAKRVEDVFGVTGLPTTYIIDREGEIREKVVGGREWDQGDIARRIRHLVRGEA